MSAVWEMRETEAIVDKFNQNFFLYQGKNYKDSSQQGPEGEEKIQANSPPVIAIPPDKLVTP